MALMLTLNAVIFAYAFNPPIKTFAEASSEQGDSETVSIPENSQFFVTIYDNGNKKIIKTTPKTVGEVLDKMGIILNITDTVEPSQDTLIDTDNFFINIYRSHPVIVKDGKTERYFMTPSYDPETIMAGARITVYDGDEINILKNDKFLETGVATIYEIKRNGGRTVTIEEEIPYIEKKIKDFNLEPGTTEVRQYGEVGRKKTVYNIEYEDNVEVSREFVSEEVVKEPVERIVAVGVSWIERSPLTPGKGRNRYTYTKQDGSVIERQETFYDLDMHLVMNNCNAGGYYTVREDGVKVDKDGYVIIAANLNYYPRCSVVETSLGAGKVYDTGSFAIKNPEQFDIATDWSNHNGN